MVDLASPMPTRTRISRQEPLLAQKALAEAMQGQKVYGLLSIAHNHPSASALDLPKD